MSSLATPLAVVFLLAIASWLTLNTMKSMRNEKEIARLVSTVEALRTSSRERQDLEAATDRNLEEELRNLRAELTSGAKAIRKEIAAAARRSQPRTSSPHSKAVSRRRSRQRRS